MLSGFLPAVSQHEARNSRHLLVGEESSKKALQKTSTLMILKENGQSELGECQSSLPQACSASANLVLMIDSLMLEHRVEPSDSLPSAMWIVLVKPASLWKETCHQLCKNLAKGNSVSFLVPVQRGPFKVRGQVFFDDIVPGVVDTGIAAEAARQLPFPLGPFKTKPSQACTCNLFNYKENRPKHMI